MNTTQNIVRLLITHDRSLLLAKILEKGFFFLPGGRIEYNESLYTAAKRELYEELDIKNEVITNIQPIQVYEHSWNNNGNPCHELNIICRCAIQGLHPGSQINSSESHLGFEWIGFADLEEIDLRPNSFKTFIPQWIELKRVEPFFESSMFDRLQK